PSPLVLSSLYTSPSFCSAPHLRRLCLLASRPSLYLLSFFFFNDTATTEIYTLSLHDALPICSITTSMMPSPRRWRGSSPQRILRSEEHTSELQSLTNLVCRLLLEKKKTNRDGRDRRY